MKSIDYRIIKTILKRRIKWKESFYPILSLSSSNQDWVVSDGKKHGSLKWSRELRNKTTQICPTDF